MSVGKTNREILDFPLPRPCVISTRGCPNCMGNGTLAIPGSHQHDGVSHPNHGRQRCERCKGKGTVPAEDAVEGMDVKETGDHV